MQRDGITEGRLGSSRLFQSAASSRSRPNCVKGRFGRSDEDTFPFSLSVFESLSPTHTCSEEKWYDAAASDISRVLGMYEPTLALYARRSKYHILLQKVRLANGSIGLIVTRKLRPHRIIH